MTRMFGAIVGLALIAAAQPAAAQWRRLESPNFVVIGDTSARALRDVAVEFEGFRETLTRVLGDRVTASAVPTVVIVFLSETAIAPFRPIYNGKPVDVGGLFVPGRDLNYIALIDDGNPERLPTIFHEYTHLLISHPDQPLPLWLNEGIAEYYSSFELQKNGREALLGKIIDDHLATLNHTVLIPLDDLIQMNHDSPLYNEGSRRGVFYAQAWAMTHLVLLGTPPRLTELNAYLGNLMAGDPPVKAWHDAFGGVNMQKALEDYIRQQLFKAYKPAFSDSVTKFDATATPLKPLDVQALLADFQVQMRALPDAAARLDQARKIDPAAPSVVIGAARLAMAQRDAGRDAATATPTSTAGIGLDGLEPPRDWLLAYLGGVVIADSMLDRGGQPTPKDLALVQRFLASAAAAHPVFLNAASRQAELELRTDAGPSAETAAALATARAPARNRYQYAFLHAQVLARRGEFAQAREVVAPFVGGAYPADVRTSARSLMGYVVAAENARTRGAASGVPPAPPKLPAALSTDTGTTGTTETSSTPSIPRPVFRDLKPGEQRLEGALTQIECVQTRGVTFHIRVGQQDVTSVSPSLTGVEFISYRDDLRGSIECGPLAAPMAVYLTWKPDPSGAKIAVAIEFLPKTRPRPMS